jgi:hypothetical protein
MYLPYRESTNVTRHLYYIDQPTRSKRQEDKDKYELRRSDMNRSILRLMFKGSLTQANYNPWEQSNRGNRLNFLA